MNTEKEYKCTKVKATFALTASTEAFEVEHLPATKRPEYTKGPLEQGKFLSHFDIDKFSSLNSHLSLSRSFFSLSS